MDRVTFKNSKKVGVVKSSVYMSFIDWSHFSWSVSKQWKNFVCTVAKNACQVSRKVFAETFQWNKRFIIPILTLSNNTSHFLRKQKLESFVNTAFHMSEWKNRGEEFCLSRSLWLHKNLLTVS